MKIRDLQLRIREAIVCFIMVLFLLISKITFAQQVNFPYEIKKMDYALVPAGIAVLIAGENLVDSREIMTTYEIASLNRNDVNGFDRSATRKFSSSADDASDLLRTSLVMMPSLLVGHQLLNQEWSNAITYGVMYFEAFLYTKGLTAMVKASTKRIRPYLYNDNLTVEERYDITKDRDSYGSLFSGHTSAVFASGVCLAKTFTDIYGKSIWSKVVWGTSLTAASLCGYYRYASGEHYPTDVICGALFGAAVGYMIPVLYKKSTSDKLSFTVNPKSVYFTYRF